MRHNEIGKGPYDAIVVCSGIRMEYWYLSLTGTYVESRRISPFDLCESMMRRHKQKSSSEHPEDITGGEIRLLRESVGNGARNPLLIKTDALIRGWITP